MTFTLPNNVILIVYVTSLISNLIMSLLLKFLLKSFPSAYVNNKKHWFRFLQMSFRY